MFDDADIADSGLPGQPHWRMLGASLKVVFRAEETDRFDALLRALDRSDRTRPVSSPASS